MITGDLQMKLRILTIGWALGFVGLGLGGCGASLSNMTTGSLFGGDSKPAAAPQATNDPTSRAMQVGATSARAAKCGFNFDAAKLKANYLASEAPTTVTNPTDAAKLAQIYDTAFNGISKAVASQGEGYCSEQKTRTIKADLTRHLAGDYAPAPIEKQPDDSLIGDLFSGGSSSGERPKWASDTLGN